MFFCNSLAFSMIQRMLAVWSLVPLFFLNPAWTYGISQFMFCWKIAWRNYFGSMWEERNCGVAENSLKSPLMRIARKTTFSVLWSLLSFPHLLAYSVQHLNSIIFKDLIYLYCNAITPTRFALSDASVNPFDFAFQDCLALGEWSHHGGYLGH